MVDVWLCAHKLIAIGVVSAQIKSKRRKNELDRKSSGRDAWDIGRALAGSYRPSMESRPGCPRRGNESPPGYSLSSHSIATPKRPRLMITFLHCLLQVSKCCHC